MGSSQYRTRKNSNPTVGVFMPSYNQGPYINQALDSLKHQTFQNFKVIIADDGSNDGITPQVLKSIEYNKASVVLNDDNKGVAYRIKETMPQLNADYLFILCADDMIAPNYIEKTVSFLENNKEVGAVATHIQCFGDNNDLIELDETKANLPYALVEGHFLGSAMIRAEAFEEIDYGIVAKRQHDYDRWVSMMENGWRMAVINEPLFFYRQLGSSLSNSAKVSDEKQFRNDFINRHSKLYERHQKYILVELYGRLFETKSWLKELQQGKEWIESEYNKVLDENTLLSENLSNLQNEIDELRFKTKYSIPLHGILRFIRRRSSTEWKII